MATADPPAVRLAEDEVDRAAAYGVRHEVFVGEQGVPPEVERDDLDEVADHVVAYGPDGACVGAGRLVARGEAAVVGRMAVRTGERGRGVGAALLRRLEERARERGLARVELHAQAHAAGFYAGYGYQAYGEPFVEAGIEHLHMRKELS